MAGALSKRRRQEDAPYWPGFVDAMAQLLLVITFLLSVFMTAQFLLAREISGQDSALGQLRSQIAELTQLLALEKSAKGAVEANLLALSDDLSAERQKNAGPSGQPLHRQVQKARRRTRPSADCKPNSTRKRR